MVRLEGGGGQCSPEGGESLAQRCFAAGVGSGIPLEILYLYHCRWLAVEPLGNYGNFN